MFDAINKAFLVGMGLVAMAEEKVDQFAKELVEKGELSEAEARKLAENMLKKSAQARKDLKSQVEKWLEQSLDKMPLSLKKDVDRLEARLAKLEATKQKKTK